MSVRVRIQGETESRPCWRTLCATKYLFIIFLTELVFAFGRHPVCTRLVMTPRMTRHAVRRVRGGTCGMAGLAGLACLLCTPHVLPLPAACRTCRTDRLAAAPQPSMAASKAAAFICSIPKRNSHFGRFFAFGRACHAATGPLPLPSDY